MDQAVIQRIIDLAADEAGRDRITDAAIKMADDTVQQVEAEIENIRRRLATIQGEVNNLIQTIKSMGSQGLAIVQEGLQASETERQTLKARLAQLQDSSRYLRGMSDKSKRLMENWRHVGDVLKQATPNNQRAVVQHYIDEIKLDAGDAKGTTGTYEIKFSRRSLLAEAAPVAEEWSSQTPIPSARNRGQC